QLLTSITKLCAAARWTTDRNTEASIQARIRDRVARLDPKSVPWDELLPIAQAPIIHRAVILKPYVGPLERGVLFISFEKEWARLLGRCDLHEFTRRYRLVISPSSSPHNPINYIFAAAYPDQLFTLISNEGDRDVLPRVAENLVIVPQLASHWVNPLLFQPLP